MTAKRCDTTKKGRSTTKAQNWLTITHIIFLSQKPTSYTSTGLMRCYEASYMGVG